jgi:hypothetical protein
MGTTAPPTAGAGAGVARPKLVISHSRATTPVVDSGPGVFSGHGGTDTLDRPGRVLVTHPDVSPAAVVGVPHASHGEEVKAFVLRPALHPKPVNRRGVGVVEMGTETYSGIAPSRARKVGRACPVQIERRPRQPASLTSRSGTVVRRW